ncbi:MAG: BON domain-containing protein [Pseudomonadota bacterium]
MKRFLILSSLSVLVLSGCTPIGAAVGAGATVGISAAQEGGVGRAVSDAVIQAKINDQWLRHDVDIFTKLDLTVNNGRVLITGVAQEPQHRVDAVRLAWQPDGVEQVINEIRVADSEGVSGFIRDNWISTRLRSSITLDRDVQSLNYNIDTVQGIVYLMGYAQNQKELNRVIETARTIPNVKQVISYVKIVEAKDDVNWNDQVGYDPSVNQGQIQTQPPSQNFREDYSSPNPPVDNSAYNAPVQTVPIDNSAYDDGGF